METLRKVSSYGMDGKQGACKEPYKWHENGEGLQKRESRGSLPSELNVASYQKRKIHSNWRNSHTDYPIRMDYFWGYFQVITGSVYSILV